MNEGTTNLLVGKALEVVDTLATKLGVAVPHIWEVLIKQQYVAGVELLLTGLFCGIGAWYCKKFAQWGHETDDDPALTAGIIMGGLLAIISVLCLVSSLGNFINPEYYALKDILDMINPTN